MAHFKLSGHAKVPVEVWWNVATDVTRLPEWHTKVVEVKDVVGDRQVGAVATLLLRRPGGIQEFRAETIELEPLRTLKQVGRGVEEGLGSYTSISRCAPAVDGGTDWEWEQDFEAPGGRLGAVTDRLFVQPAVEQLMRQSMTRLVALAEAEVPQRV